MSDLREGGTELFSGSLKFFLVYFVTESDFSPEFGDLSHQTADVELFALGHGVVRSCLVTPVS